jgi:PII-like signaling protein
MIQDGLKLTAYLGERDRVGRRLAADQLIGVYERHGVRTSVLLRGIEGFGIRHRLQTERLLTLSEDLPMLAAAVDSHERVEALVDDVRGVSRHGVITLERALLLTGSDCQVELAPGPDEIKLTIYLARQDRVDDRPAHLAAVELLHRHGVAGASVLLGVDGIADGVRRRGRFIARNAQVPLMIVSVGDRESIARALPGLAATLREPVMTLERIRVCRRDGQKLADLAEPPAADRGAELAYWQKLMVFASEQTVHDGQPLYSALVRRLRREGAAGATALRGEWGYHGDHRPHGERFWSLGRHVPVLVVVLDTPANMRRWFEIVQEMTGETGLVTSELVPALRAAGPEIEHGGLKLADPRIQPLR